MAQRTREYSNSLSDAGPNPLQIVFLHNKFRKRSEDRYMVDMAAALQECGHNVTIYASEIDAENCLDDIKCECTLKVSNSGWWLPSRWRFWRALLMAVRVALFAPSSPKKLPTFVFTDLHPIALLTLSALSRYRIIHISHFSSLQRTDAHGRNLKMAPTFASRLLRYADEILVYSECLAGVFRRSYPHVQRTLRILQPCVDTGLWAHAAAIDIRRIAPTIPKAHFTFVCFGTYRKRSNFKLVLHAFEDLLLVCAPHLRPNVHLVIAGHCSDTQVEQQVFYGELIEYAKAKNYAKQVTFLKHLPTAYRKTLIEECLCVMLPGKHDLFPDGVLAALSMGKPIIATQTGFAREALRHRISALLIEPSPQLFAAAMYKILTNPNIPVFLGDMGHDLFLKHYSNAMFRRKINGIVRQYAELHIAKMKHEQIAWDNI